jgi:hypothetical protein
MNQIGGNDPKIKTRLSKSSPFEVKMLAEFIRRGISVGKTVTQIRIGEIDR